MKPNLYAQSLAPWLWLLLGLFCFRVVGQLLVSYVDVPLLPAFEQWHGAVLPYGLLVACQVLIILVFARTAYAFTKGSVRPNRRLGIALLAFGALYFTGMSVRLVLGVTVFAHEPWFSQQLPTVFHLVLASFVLLVGSLHASQPSGIRPAFKRYAPWLPYPVIMLLGLGLHALLMRWYGSAPLSTYVPVLMAVALVIGLEHILPHRAAWKPSREDIKNDFWYLLLVQIALPKLVIFAFVFALIEPVQSLRLPLGQLWPHHWPVGLQAILMLLTADLLRYWLHRAAHRHPLLWRFHAVHHSPAKLYRFNVGRFHPLEKALQLLLDTVPFVLLGVSESVIALYFVFYAINGFFQHSNIQLKHGVLNYVISSAELHRWHHSRCLAESNTNFGNNLSVWDLAFGTWYLPRDREVSEVGLINRAYPLGFADQLKTPFIPAITEKPVPTTSWKQISVRAVLSLALCIARFCCCRPFERATRQPRAIQARVLREVIQANRDTVFGRRHDFADIHDYEAYKRKVPIREYEDLRPYIDRQLYEGTSALTADMPIMYAQTSGTTGKPKYVPVLDKTLKQYKHEQRLFSLYQYCRCPEAFAGKALGIVSPAIEGYFKNGVPYGSVSGHIYRTLPKWMQEKSVVPPEVFDIDDYDLKYKVMVRLALTERDITYLGGANPSSFLRLLGVLQEHTHELIESVASGKLALPASLKPAITAAIRRRLQADPTRASELRALAAAGRLTYRDIWPRIQMLTTWTGGSCGIALNTLKKALPAASTVLELGYIATEFRGSMTAPDSNGSGIPTLSHNFFEFVARDRWERGEQETLLLHELIPGEDYYVIVTTANGLYRYFMNDIVRVDGFFNRTPLIRFVRKGKGVTNITGEKLYENQVIEALDRVHHDAGVSVVFFMALADAKTSRYRLFFEADEGTCLSLTALAGRIDAALRAFNVEYDQKRASGRLGRIEVLPLRAGTHDAYKRFCLQCGQREGQFKPLVLQYEEEFTFPIGEYLTTPTALAS